MSGADTSDYLATGYLFFSMLICITGWLAWKRWRDGGLIIFNFVYLLFFGFYPLNLIFLGIDGTRQRFVFERFGAGQWSTLATLFLSYVLFFSGYALARRHLDGTSNEPEFTGENFHRPVFFLGLFFLALGLVGYIYQIVQFGGLNDALDNAACVRASVCGLTGNFVFLRQLNPFFGTGFVILWCAFVGNSDNSRRSLLSDSVALAILVTMYAVLSALTNGRRDFYYPMITCVLCVLLSKVWTKIRQPRFLIGCGSLAVSIIIWSVLARKGSSAYNQVILGFQIKDPQFSSPVARYLYFSYVNTIQGIGDSFMHFVAMQNAGLWRFGFLQDLIELPLQFVPSRLLGFERGRGVLGETSEFILGHRLAEGTTGEEPPGLHGYLLINFGYVGLFVLFMVFGLIYRRVTKRLLPKDNQTPGSWLPYIFVLMLGLEFLRDGFLVFLLKSRLSWILIIFTWIMVTRSESKKNSPTKIIT